jgi:hypothetical protein
VFGGLGLARILTQNLLDFPFSSKNTTMFVLVGFGQHFYIFWTFLFNSNNLAPCLVGFGKNSHTKSAGFSF